MDLQNLAHEAANIIAVQRACNERLREELVRALSIRASLNGALRAIADYTDQHGGWTETAHDAGVVSGLVHEMADAALTPNQEADDD
jgi:hypothetical protein